VVASGRKSCQSLLEMPRRRSKVDFRPEMETRRPRPRNRLDLSAMTIRAVLLGMMFWTTAVYTYESFGLSRAANVRSSMVLMWAQSCGMQARWGYRQLAVTSV
jgi:hypothetical protein